jgi:hypothetical protein
MQMTMLLCGHPRPIMFPTVGRHGRLCAINDLGLGCILGARMVFARPSPPRPARTPTVRAVMNDLFMTFSPVLPSTDPFGRPVSSDLPMQPAWCWHCTNCNRRFGGIGPARGGRIGRSRCRTYCSRPTRWRCACAAGDADDVRLACPADNKPIRPLTTAEGVNPMTESTRCP